MPAASNESPKLKVNGTSRLVTFLDKMSNTGSSRPTANVVTEILGIKTVDYNRSALLAFSILTRMIEFAEKEANAHLTEVWETVGPHFAGVRACFTPAASGIGWDQRKSNLTASDLTGIRHTAAHLRTRVSENEVTGAEIADLRVALDEMESGLAADDGVSEYTRELLNARIAAIRAALEEYRFWGIAEIERVYREFVGTIITSPIVREDLSQSEKNGGSVGKKVWAVILGLGSLISLANSAADFDKKVLPMIEHMILPAPSTPATDAPKPRIEQV